MPAAVARPSSRTGRLGACLLAALVAATLAAPGAVPGADAQEADAGRYQSDGDAGGFWNIMPPGQHGVVNVAEALPAQGGQFPEHFNDQTPLYENLVYAAGLPSADQDVLGLSDGDVPSFFKDGSFGIAGEVARRYSPGDVEGLVILRDAEFGVPHIYGETRTAAMFGAGYATAEDRLFLMDVLRHLGRARLSEFLGASEANMAMDREQLAVAPYTDEEYTEQFDDLCGQGEVGQQVCDDARAYVDGANTYIDDAMADPRLLPAEYPALQILPEDFIVEDAVAIASLVGGIFGRGGGNEVANGRFLAQLQAEYGQDQGRVIFEDFRSANDPEAAHTIDTPFPYNNHDPAELDPASVALLDLDTVEETMAEMSPVPLIADGPFGPLDFTPADGMSNAILLDAEHTDTGGPIAVFGPQTGYFTPQLLVEMAIHAPGIAARGAAFAGTNIYVQLGRGTDYAWSATSAGGDNVDEWVVELCEEDGSEPTAASQAYVYDGTCTPMDVYTHSQTAKPTAGGIDLPPTGPPVIQFDVEIERTVYGPVIARGTVAGAPVAVSEQRSTYGSELDSAIGFNLINNPDFMAGGAEAFAAAFDGVDYTFNWFYADTEDIAFKHSCLCPIRDPRTDVDLPTWGTGEWDWTGEFLAPADQPRAVNPPSGFFANWNNKQAPEFRANDAEYSYSSTYRSEFLATRMRALVAGGRPATRADMVDIAEDAGTVDLNGQEIYPLLLRILGSAVPNDDPVLEAMRDRLVEWVADGGNRRDVDGDGVYDHAVAVAIGDALLVPMLDAVLADALAGADWPQGVENHPRLGQGSAYNGGRATFLHKDFRQVLGDDVDGPRSRTYCGQPAGAEASLPAGAEASLPAGAEASLPAGAEASLPAGAEADAVDLDDCRDALWGAVRDAALILRDTYGSENVDDWVYDSTLDEIVQSAVGLVAAPNMQWVNRPTFQQVVEAGSRTGRIDGATRIGTAVFASRQAFPAGTETVVVASAADFADAVAATPLAAARAAPLLLSAPDGLPTEAAREIRRLGAGAAIVLGGEAALAPGVVADLEALGVTVQRIAGENRYDTAARIAAELGSTSGTVVVASGEDFPDALAAGPYAAAVNAPILLTRPGDVPPETRAAVDAAQEVATGPLGVVVAGGPAAISAAVFDDLEQGDPVARRIAGADRYETAVAFADEALASGASLRTVYVASGEAFPDALAAGAAAARTGAVLVLAPRDGDAQRASEVLGRDGVRFAWVLGGETALTSGTRRALEAALD